MDYSEILLEAKELLSAGALGDSHLRTNATVLRPIPVTDPDGKLHSWWVPLTVMDKLVAFFQFLKNGSYMRFSTFQRNPGNYDSCPLAKDWLDEDRIKEFAAEKIQKGESLQKPYLTYDNNPERLAWAVPVTDAKGKERLIYVTGGYAYEKN